MTSEKWKRIKETFEAALRRGPDDRARFLDEVCGEDDEMRGEVEALLSSFERVGSFMAEPLVGEVALQATHRISPVMPGLQLGTYRIEAQLGQGGMGVVYRALDLKFNRPVAVKFLSDDLADTSARRRFQREAQMVSALNHPHILTVFDAGEFEGRQYLVMEFIDGGTLKDWAATVERSWRQIVELLAGVADGLAAAHEAGILHRDIKPENILVARNGYAKLADFGLAKLAEAAPEAETALTEARTRQGVIIGSIPYMSPEQASGKPLDARSDLFSFGSVLFEMLGGRRPFEGKSSLEVLQAIIHGPPLPLSKLCPDLPPALRVAVEKSLEKRPADRYQTMRELVADLRLVSQSAETPAPPRRAGRQKWAAALLVFAIIIVGGLMIRMRPSQPATPMPLQYTQLTNFADSATNAALSPDGRMLTFVRGPNTFFGPGQVYMKLLPDGEPVQLTNSDDFKMSPKFSPDGTNIAYSTASADFMSMDTWSVPVRGGPPRRLLTNAEGLTWVQQPNTQASAPPVVMFSELTGLGGQMSIVSSSETRTDPRNVYVPPGGDGMAHRSYVSPNGKSVIVIEMDGRSWLPCRLVPFDGSSAGKPVGPSPAQCTDAGWSPDGRWMYFSVYNGNGTHIWRQPFPDGAPEQVTFGVTSEEGIHFAPDGRSFVTSIGTSHSTIWVHDTRGDRQITSEGSAFQPAISRDGKNLYYLVRSGGARNWFAGTLWMADLESGRRRRLLPDFVMQQYSISADGRRVVFGAVDDTGRSPLWLADLDGNSSPRRLTSLDAGFAFFGRPGDIVFGGMGSDQFIYVIKEDGTQLQKIIQTPLLPFGVSPDSRLVPVMDPKAWGALMLYQINGGPPIRICDACSPPQGTDPMPPPLSWTPDGKFVYLKFGNSTYAIPLKPGQLLPQIPGGGFSSRESVAELPGTKLISNEPVYPGPNPSIYAFTKVSAQRNIYRVRVP
jgi:eukaryotic-like serine/threonine-protein kinase